MGANKGEVRANCLEEAANCPAVPQGLLFVAGEQLIKSSWWLHSEASLPIHLQATFHFLCSLQSLLLWKICEWEASQEQLGLTPLVF